MPITPQITDLAEKIVDKGGPLDAFGLIAEALKLIAAEIDRLDEVKQSTARGFMQMGG